MRGRRAPCKHTLGTLACGPQLLPVHKLASVSSALHTRMSSTGSAPRWGSGGTAASRCPLSSSWCPPLSGQRTCRTFAPAHRICPAFLEFVDELMQSLPSAHGPSVTKYQTGMWLGQKMGEGEHVWGRLRRCPPEKRWGGRGGREHRWRAGVRLELRVWGKRPDSLTGQGTVDKPGRHTHRHTRTATLVCTP